MRKYFYFMLVAFLATSAHAQHSVQFGFITPAETSMKSVLFDPEASAVVLVDEGYSDYNDDNGLITYYHQRIKILKEDGIKYADTKLSYYSQNEFETVDQIEAVSINIDESGIRRDNVVERKNIYSKKLNKYRTEISFAFPNVKVGTIIEYQYRVVAKSYGGLRDWYFQSDLPVVKSTYRLAIVPGHEVSYLVQYNPRYKVDVKDMKSDHAIKFEMNNIPALTDEPYMDSRSDYIQKVIFQTTKYLGDVGTVNFMSTWKEVIKELNSRTDFGRQLKINIDECNQFISELNSSGKSDTQKMQTVHKYVMNNLTWDRVYGITAENGIKTLWKKKSGNSGEINLLLVNLLREAGLEAYPMLVSERGNGKVNKDQPFIRQFNNIYAAVIINGKNYYLDATDNFTPSHLVPYNILNSTGFIVDNKMGGLIDIQENNVRYRHQVNVMATLTENGELSGTVGVESKDYARTEKVREYTRYKADYVNEYIKKNLVNVDVANYAAKNTEEENMPFTESFDFKTRAQTSGEYIFISPNMFGGMQSNPFIVNDRFSPVNFGYKKTMNVVYLLKIPANYKLDALPKSIKMTNGGRTISFTREFFLEGDQLLTRIKVDIDKTLYGIDEYPEIQDLFKKMVGMMNEQIVLKKK